MALMKVEEPTTILKRDAVGRVSVPKEKREALLDEFERSSLKGAEFARAAGVRYATFAYWVQQRRHARGQYQPKVSRSALRLVEAALPSAAILTPPASVEPAAARQPEGLEVLLPGGARIRVANATQVELAAQLLKALAKSC
jgi:hypothetical protein